MNKACIAALLILCLFSVFGCAGKKAAHLSPTGQETVADENLVLEEEAVQPDALEGVNRGIFSFNDGFISYVFTPINTVYTGFFPQDIRNGFGNFYRNLGYPVRLVNALLQFKFDKIGKETASFAMNTVFGVGGLFHITRDMPSLKSSPEDFGQTLAFYGVGHGTYLVLPIIGPSSLRDAVGSVADSFAHPLSWVQPDSAKFALVGHDKANTASANLPTYENIKAESFDHYTSMKDVYFQYRTSLEEQ